MAYQPITLRDFDFQESIGNPLFRAAQLRQREEEAAAAALLGRAQLAEQRRSSMMDEGTRASTAKSYREQIAMTREENARSKQIQDEARKNLAADRRKKLLDEADVLDAKGDTEGARRLRSMAGATEVPQEAPTERIKLDRRITMDPIAIERGGKTGPVTGVSVSGGAEQDIPTGETPRGTRYRTAEGQEFVSDPEGLRERQREVASAATQRFRPAFEYKGKDEEIRKLYESTWQAVETGAISDPFEALKELRNRETEIEANRARMVSARKPAGGNGGAPSPVVINDVAKLDNDIKAVDELRAIVEENPDAWQRYAKRREEWDRAEKLNTDGGLIGKLAGAPRKFGQAMGMVDISLEQGLKGDPEALRVHQRMERVVTSIAKGYGGVITESDAARALSSVATLGLSPEQAVETIRGIFDDLKHRRDSLVNNSRGGARLGSTPRDAAPRMNPLRKAAIDDDDDAFIRGGKR